MLARHFSFVAANRTASGTRLPVLLVICTILRLSAPLFDELFGGVRHDHGAIRLATGAQLRHSAALTLWRGPSVRYRLADEELALGLLGAVRHEFDSDGAARSSPGAQRLIARVQGRLAAAPEQAHHLATLAAEVAVSPFDLCRLFRRETGLTVRQYRLRLRLAVALERLTEGQDDLASLAVELGFSHHNHLTAVFPSSSAPPARRARGIARCAIAAGAHVFDSTARTAALPLTARGEVPRPPIRW